MDLAALTVELSTGRRERPDVEFKSAAGGFPESAIETMGAFANLPGGGVIILGIDEKGGFRPVRLSDPDGLAASLVSRARTAFDPPLHVDVSVEPFEGFDLVVARVRELPPPAKPCVVKRSGKAYLRFADGDYTLSQLEIDGFVAARSRPQFDEQPIEEATTDDLDNDRVADFVATARAADRNLARLADDRQLLTKLGVLSVSGTPTTAGLIALGRYPQQFLPHCNIRAAILPDDTVDITTVRALDSATFTGPIAVILEDAVAWVGRNSRRRLVENPATGHVSEQLVPPPVAVREFLANSVVHRDLAPWASSRAIELRMSASTFRLTNPGGLYGVTADRLGIHPLTSARNRQLVEICKYVRTADGNVVEALATGIPRALVALRAASVPPPRFFDQGLSFTVTLNSGSIAVPELQPPGGVRDVALPTPAEQVVLDRLGAPRTIAELVEELGITANAAHKRLASLRAKGLVEIHGGTGRLSRYARTA